MAYKTVNKPLAWFIANDENYRGHTEHQVSLLQESLRTFGIFKNVVARPDGTVLCGHGILAAAQAEGMKTLPVQIFEGTDAEARALMVADNELSRPGLVEDDPDQLSQLLTSLAADGLMEVTGHDDDSLAALLEQVEAQAPPTGVLPGDTERMTLAERFGVPPFSVLDARQGYWQDRKRKWLATGIQSELGRGGALGAVPSNEQQILKRTGRYAASGRGLGARVANAEATDAGYYRKKRQLEKKLGREATREEVLALG